MNPKGAMPAYPPMMQVMADVTFQPIHPTWTKREVFAIAAMQGMAMRVLGVRDSEVALAAVNLADATLAALEESP